MLVRTELNAYSLCRILWDGGADTLQYLTAEEIETVLGILEELSPAGGFSLGYINDFFWFEKDTIAEWLGYSDFDALIDREEV